MAVVGIALAAAVRSFCGASEALPKELLSGQENAQNPMARMGESQTGTIGEDGSYAFTRENGNGNGSYTDIYEAGAGFTLEERELLWKLWDFLEETDMTEATRLLNENEEEFAFIFYETMEGKPYFYSVEKLGSESSAGQDVAVISRKPSGKGVWFQSSSTLFFGNFGENGLEGQGLALQAICLEAPRYDYSVGAWKDGKMNGAGTVGYLYYDGVSGEEAREMKKEGNFADDLMDGPVTYTSVNNQGVETRWELKAKKGVTVLDEEWKHDKEKKNYGLTSRSDAGRIYLLAEDEADEVRWRNMITMIWP